MRFDMISKPLFRGLLLALVLMGAKPSGRACQYCRMAATDPEAARMAAQIHGGGFPLDATINQFAGIAPAATLTAPPAPDSVATSAADLPVPAARRSLPPPPTLPVLKAPMLRAPVAVSTREAKTPPPIRWSDAGLLGLAAAGGLFCWRTRRVAAARS